ncbi:guanylate kinase [bacterium 1XD8-76]|nr:guanylate kinase [bacterium 1XD8-76]
MGKIIYLMGKSSSGKDTVYKRLLEQKEPVLHTVVLYTTRPVRAGETDGTEYHFTDEAGFQKMREEGKVIEDRVYHTVQGLWRYFTVVERETFEAEKNYLMIGTLVSYEKVRDYFGGEKMVPVFIDLDDGERLQRALDRERAQGEPQYEEMCRRFLADVQDFSEEKIAAAGIERRFMNDDLDRCLSEILEYIKEELCCGH